MCDDEGVWAVAVVRFCAPLPHPQAIIERTKISVESRCFIKKVSQMITKIRKIGIFVPNKP